MEINGDQEMKIEASPRQKVVLEALKKWISENGWPPTRAELAKDLGIASPNGVDEHLKALAKKGHITMVPKVSRGIRIVA